MYPEADIYTSVFLQHNNPKYQGRKVYTSYIQKIPYIGKKHKLCMLLRPSAFARFNFSKYNIVISSSSAEAKHIRTNKKTKHICYCHTPTRYLWSHTKQYKNMLEFGIFNPLARCIMNITFPFLRKLDYKAAKNVDIFIANSQTTQKRIQKYYQRESEVIHPFFQKNIQPKEIKNLPEKYFFAIGRIVPYKKFDVLVEAFNNLPSHHLIIAT